MPHKHASQEVYRGPPGRVAGCCELLGYSGAWNGVVETPLTALVSVYLPIKSESARSGTDRVYRFHVKILSRLGKNIDSTNLCYMIVDL